MIVPQTNHERLTGICASGTISKSPAILAPDHIFNTSHSNLISPHIAELRVRVPAPIFASHEIGPLIVTRLDQMYTSHHIVAERVAVFDQIITSQTTAPHILTTCPAALRSSEIVAVEVMILPATHTSSDICDESVIVLPATNTSPSTGAERVISLPAAATVSHTGASTVTKLSDLKSIPQAQEINKNTEKNRKVNFFIIWVKIKVI